MSKKHRGQFQPGDDPRRHQLTRKERRRGYKNALSHGDPKIAAWVYRKVRARYRAIKRIMKEESSDE